MTMLSADTVLRIEVRGEPLGERDARAIVQAIVMQRVNAPTLCEVTFVDPTGSVIGGNEAIAVGDDLRLWVEGRDTPVFGGRVSAITRRYGPAAGTEVRLRAYDALQSLRTRRPLKVHVQASTPDLFRELVAPLGLSVECDDAGPLWPRLVQVARDDLDFLARAAGQRGLWFWLDGGTVRLMTAAGTDEEIPLTLGENLLEAVIEHNGVHVCSAVEVVGFSAVRIEPHTATADRPRSRRNAEVDVIGSEQEGDNRRIIANTSLRSDDQALALAQAELDAAYAAVLVCTGVAVGDPALRPGAGVRLSGVAPDMEGVYTLTGVTHRFTAASGYVCEFTSVPPAASVGSGLDDSKTGGDRRATQGDAGVIMTVGVVRGVDDPDGLGRIQVSLLVGGDLESDWMGVVFPGAGDRKGLIALPDVGDHVLVLLPRDLTGQGIVLGGLYGTRGLPDGEPSGNAVKRFVFMTPGGQRLSLDDSSGTLCIENHSGSKMRLSPQVVELHAATKLIIEAPGQQVLIRGARIDFEKA